MTSSGPTVSVVVATRDRPILIDRALASIAAQTFGDFEVIIVDDGSTEEALDGYQQLCARYGSRFRVNHSVPARSLGSGPAAVRNRGIQAAQGKFVAFLDDDDEWMKTDHLEVAVQALTSSQADFYFADIQGIRGDTVAIETWYAHPPQEGARAMEFPAGKVFGLQRSALVRVFRHHMIHPDCWVVDRQLLRDLGGFNERLRFVEDLELGVRIADACRSILYRAEPVVRYRLPEDDAESLKYDRQTIQLQYLLAAQTLQATCTRKEVRRCARARAGWTLRQIAKELTARGRPSAATSFAWQSLVTFPTFGSLLAFGAALVGIRPR